MAGRSYDFVTSESQPEATFILEVSHATIGKSQNEILFRVVELMLGAWGQFSVSRAVSCRRSPRLFFLFERLAMNGNLSVITQIQSNIITLPKRPRFMLVHVLADLYQVKPKNIHKAVKRNQERFPEDFCFQLTEAEAEAVRFQTGTKIYAGAERQPYAFTREGANMLSAVLRSPIAIERSVQIMRAFSAMEELAQRQAKRRSTIEWMEAREQGKIERKELTDALKRLKSLADEQNPKNNAGNYYSTFTRTIYSILFNVKKIQKDEISEPALRKLQMIEAQVAEWVNEWVDQKVDYHLPHREVKEKVSKLVAIIGNVDLSLPATIN
jgi:formiminotetrahydrofolate cyclodeaminase